MPRREICPPIDQYDIFTSAEVDHDKFEMDARVRFLCDGNARKKDGNLHCYLQRLVEKNKY